MDAAESVRSAAQAEVKETDMDDEVLRDILALVKDRDKYRDDLLFERGRAEALDQEVAELRRARDGLVRAENDLRAVLGAHGTTLADAAEDVVRRLLSARGERDAAAAQLRRIAAAVDAEPGADLVGEVVKLRERTRVAIDNSKQAWSMLEEANRELAAARGGNDGGRG